MSTSEPNGRMDSIMGRISAVPSRINAAWLDSLTTSVLFINGMMRSHLDFVIPFLTASNSFWQQETKRIPGTPITKNWQDYSELLRFNLQIAEAGWASSRSQMSEYYLREF